MILYDVDLIVLVVVLMVVVILWFFKVTITFSCLDFNVGKCEPIKTLRADRADV